MEILWNDSQIWYACGIRYWYVVLAGMEFWNEDHIYRIPYHGMERHWNERIYNTIPWYGKE